MPGELLAAALRYAELGYPVFPCAPGTKTPLTDHGHLDATTDPDQIEQWWTQRPNSNVAIATAGLVVIDVDAESTWLADSPERALELAAAPLSLTANDGRHYVFRQPAGRTWRNTTGRLAQHVDTRADGGYIVVPPSVLADGRAYRWAEGLELDVSPNRLPEPPPWLVTQLDGSATASPTLAHVATDAGGANPIPAGQRNATLARLAGTMRRVGMSQAEIAAALLQTNRDRCVPPLPPHEVERIAASVARYEPDAVSVAFAENHFEQMSAETAIDESPRDADPGPIPDELLHVPGFIDDVMRYTLDTAPYPEPVLAFAGALALQAFLAGRKVRDAMGNRTNLYVLSLASSGVGKDHARKVNARILVEADLADGLGTSFASGEGIEDRLFEQPVTLFQVDEIDGLLSKINQAKDARHEAIVSILLQMYSAASTVYVLRAKAGRERMVIDQPCLCIFGTAVPKHFYQSLTAKMLTNGFLARFVVLESRGRGAGRDDTERPVPESILAAARWWADFRPGGNLSSEHPIPLLVEATEDAKQVFAGLRERIDSEYYAQCQAAQDEVGLALWSRSYEKARRLALIYACSQDRHSLTITREAAEWAAEFVLHQTRRMVYMSSRHIAESEFDARCKRLLEILEAWRRDHGEAWMPAWRVNRKLPWSLREHDEVRQALVQQRLIECGTAVTGGRPGAVLRLSAPKSQNCQNCADNQGCAVDTADSS